MYLGAKSGTSAHRQAALRRIGCEVQNIDPRDAFPRQSLANSWIWHAGGIGMEAIARRYVLSQLRFDRYDLCIVDCGELVGPTVLSALRKHARRIGHYNADNPFVPRDKRRWRLMLKALPGYDLFATPRVSTAEEVTRRGLKVLRFIQAADEVVHRRRAETPEDRSLFESDVAFIGTWMPERGPFLVKMLDAGINVRIFGAHWSKAPEYGRLQSQVVLDRMLGDEDYVRAIQYAKIALGFVSLQNHDLHTNRTVEVPAVGTLLCAQRTSQHLELFREGEEAVFWDDVSECTAHCRSLLDNPMRLAAVAAAGHRRQTESANWNESLMTAFVEAAMGEPLARPREVAC